MLNVNINLSFLNLIISNILMKKKGYTVEEAHKMFYIVLYNEINQNFFYGN